MPRRLAILGAKGDRRANAIRGKVVILPARALLIPKSSLINDTKAPAEVKGARKFDATRITPITKKTIKFLLFCCSNCLFKVSPPKILNQFFLEN